MEHRRKEDMLWHDFKRAELPEAPLAPELTFARHHRNGAIYIFRIASQMTHGTRPAGRQVSGKQCRTQHTIFASTEDNKTSANLHILGLRDVYLASASLIFGLLRGAAEDDDDDDDKENRKKTRGKKINSISLSPKRKSVGRSLPFSVRRSL